MAVFDPQALDRRGGFVTRFRKFLAHPLAELGCKRVDLADRRARHAVREAQRM
jgi:hypothetical protein